MHDPLVCMDDRSPVVASSAYSDVISPALIVFVFCRFVWVWKIIVVLECVPKRQDIASLDCDGNPSRRELCFEWLWIDRGDSLSDVVCEFDCFRVPGTSCFQSEWNKIWVILRWSYFLVFRTRSFVSRRPCIQSSWSNVRLSKDVYRTNRLLNKNCIECRIIYRIKYQIKRYYKIF